MTGKRPMSRPFYEARLYYNLAYLEVKKKANQSTARQAQTDFGTMVCIEVLLIVLKLGPVTWLYSFHLLWLYNHLDGVVRMKDCDTD